MTGRLLIIDDDRMFCRSIGDFLAADGVDVVAAHTVEEAQRLMPANFHVALVDNHLPDGRGLELLRSLPEEELPTRVIVVTANPSLENAVEALRLNIVDYLTKPIDVEAMRSSILRGLREAQALVPEALPVPPAPMLRAEGPSLPLDSPWHEIVSVARRAASITQPVLILGETGTGKTRLAKWIHEASPRADRPFVALNCAALPETLVEAELFGVARGAYTGAHAARRGLLELADGGTLLLDEIGELSLAGQAKLLGVIEDQVFRRIGDEHERRVDVRLLAATHVDLDAAVVRKQFRADLLFRLNVFPIRTPSLRERKCDLPALVATCLGTIAPRRIHDLGSDELRRLQDYDWPGNLRELRNTIERSVILHTEGTLRPSSLLGTRPSLPKGTEAIEHPPLTLREVERNHILRVLELSKGHRQDAAERLGISAATLRRKLKEFE